VTICVLFAFYLVLSFGVEMSEGFSQIRGAGVYKSLPSSHTTKIFEFVRVNHSAHDIYSRR
jgi:hypothetical protein